MAKALTGYLSSDLHDPRLRSDNARLRARVAELEHLVVQLKEENDRLLDGRASQLLDPAVAGSMGDLQPV